MQRIISFTIKKAPYVKTPLKKIYARANFTLQK